MEYPRKPQYKDFGIKEEELPLFNKLNSKFRRIKDIAHTILWLLVPVSFSLWFILKFHSLENSALGIFHSLILFLVLIFISSVFQLFVVPLNDLLETIAEKTGKFYTYLTFSKKERRLFEDYRHRLSAYNSKYFDFEKGVHEFHERHTDAIPYGYNIKAYITKKKQEEKEWALKIAERERLKEVQKKKQEYWFNLTGYEFEKEIKDLYQKMGYRAECTPKSGDGGVDIKAYDKQENLTIIQCKNHRKKIGPATVRELFGVMHSLKAHKATLICTGGFNQSVKDFAKDNNIQLLDINDIINKQKSMEPNPWKKVDS